MPRYNAVLTELLPVEEPLLEDRIAKMDQALVESPKRVYASSFFCELA